MTQAPAATLAFDDVGVTFPDGTTALHGVTLTVDRGEFVSVVGPSGCGKSTLLRLASGLTAATAGETRVDTTRIGYVFQDPTLLPWRDVRANVELSAELSGVPRAQRRVAAQRAIELVGLSGFEEHLPKTLSGGMRMRTSLARALTGDPALFLFDEPFGALDEITRERLNDELLALFADRRFAGLFVTHSVSEAVYLSTRVVVMSGRPGTVVREFPVDLPVPRDPDVRFTPEFSALVGEISHALKDGYR